MAKWIYNDVEFKVGDKVKVVRATETRASNAMGQGITWKNSWNREMNVAIGESATIYGITVNGVTFKTVDGDSVLNYVAYPLSSLEKVNLLPKGDFKLAGKDGVKYDLIRRQGTNCVTFELPFITAHAMIYATDEQVVVGINTGFWTLTKSVEVVEKEERLEAVEAELQNLITEKHKLEMELAI